MRFYENVPSNVEKLVWESIEDGYVRVKSKNFRIFLLDKTSDENQIIF